jgi:hypothetical protein
MPDHRVTELAGLTDEEARMRMYEVEEYNSRIAKNIKEAQELVDAGFDYVCDYAEEGKLFRKRK